MFDSLGRTTRTEVDGLTPIDLAYNAEGRLSRITQGSRISDYAYFGAGASKGMLESVTSALGIQTAMTRDAAGRVLSTTTNDVTTGFSWDPMDNLRGVTPPDRPEHEMGYTPVNLMSSYEPPTASLPTSETSYDYNLDRQHVSTLRPDGLTLSQTYDTAGRSDSLTIPGGVISAGYLATGSGQGHLSELAGPYGVDLSFEYDGSLPRRTIWSGDVAGSVRRDYTSDLVPNFEIIGTPTGTTQVAYGYDADLLLTCVSPSSCGPTPAGGLSITRDARHGLPTQLDQNSAREVRTYNSFGELATQQVTYAGASRMSETYHTTSNPRDALGRVVNKVEVVDGVTSAWRYTYDALGRLTDVALNGAAAEHFDYDANGNRTGYTSATTGTVSASYDDQDRLREYGDWSYSYGANGELQSKLNTATGDTTEYVYDVLGNLLSVSLPDGRFIEYLVDAAGRRVGKKVDGVLVQQWLYRDALKPIAELDGSGHLAKQFFYGTSGLVPEFMTIGTSTYRIISDQLGSPRMAIDIATGAIVAKMQHSAFGEVLRDTNPGLLPFGFAGGLYDVDTGLVRFGARDYDATAGRWLAKDSSLWGGGTTSLYRYSWNDPQNFQDPSGRVPAASEQQFMAWINSWLVPEPPSPPGLPFDMPLGPPRDEHANRNQHNRCPSNPPNMCGGSTEDDFSFDETPVLGGKYRGQGGSECAYDADGNLMPDPNQTFNFYPDPWTAGHMWNDFGAHFWYGGAEGYNGQQTTSY